MTAEICEMFEHTKNMLITSGIIQEPEDKSKETIEMILNTTMEL